MTLNGVQCNTFAAINRCKGFAGLSASAGKEPHRLRRRGRLNVDMTVILVPSAMVGSFMKEVAVQSITSEAHAGSRSSPTRRF